MRQILKEFHLDPEFTALDRDFHAATGRAYLELAAELKPTERGGVQKRFRELCVIAATNLRRAAAHSILLDEWQQAAGYFNAAGSAYELAGLPFSAFMMMLSGGQRGGSYAGVWLEQRVSTPNWYLKQMVYPVLADSANRSLRDDRDYERMRAELAAQRTAAVGYYGLTIGDYLDLASSFDSTDAGRVMEALVPFLAAWNGAMRRAMADRYQWERMTTPFHPAEPDLLAPVFAAVVGAQTRRFSLRESLEAFPLQFLTRQIMESAVEQAESRFRPPARER